MIITRFHTRIKIESRQLKWLIIAMAGTVLAAIQIMNCVFSGKEPIHGVFDWAFAMAIIAALVIFSFRRLDKIQEELITKEQEATESRRSLQHIIDNTEDAIVVFDKSGNCTFVNKALEKMSGYPLEKLTAINLRELIAPEDYRFLMDKTLNSPIDELTAYDNFYCVLQQQCGGKLPIKMHLMPVRNRDGDISGYEAVIRQVRDQHYETERTRQERERCLKAVAKVGHIMLSSQTEIPYEQILDLLGRAIEATSASITLRNGYSTETKQPLKIADWQNPELLLRISEKAPPHTAPDSEPHQMERETKHPQLPLTSPNRYSHPALILPLVTSQGPVGFITFCKQPGNGEWNPLHINLLQTASSMLAGAIERQRANKLLKQHFVSLARAMAGSISFIDPYTASHQERVARMARQIGTKLGLNNEQCEWLHFGGLLHDIGKAAIPVSILSKPGKLEAEEWVLIKSHVKRGCQLLQEIELPEIVIKMVLQHHERLDGSGYPNSVSGDEICLEARILAVCDVVEAMSSHRPYRPALPLNQILTELKSNRGTKYDAQVTELVLELINSDSNFLRNDYGLEAAAKIIQGKTI